MTDITPTPKLLRTIRLDASDTFVFDRAAQPGEWAVPGGFAFLNVDPSQLEGRARVAFRGGFLGLSTLGWSTLVQVVTASEADYRDAIQQLACRLQEHFGAPDAETARQAAAEEFTFAASLAAQPPGTVIAVHRAFEDGAIRETFRTLRPRDGEAPLRAFSFLDAEGDESEPMDLIGLPGKEP